MDEARGIYLYNMAIFNNGGVIEDILPESDRMLFAHRKSTLNAFLGITVCMLYVIVIMFFVWHTRQYRLFFPVTAAFILIYFFAILYLPKRVSKKKLSKKSRNFPGSDNYTCYREDSRYNQNHALCRRCTNSFCQYAD